LSAPRQEVDSVLASLGIPAELVAARRLVPQTEATQLVIAGISDEGRQFLLVPDAARAWQIMRSAAARAGVTLTLVSAFRSISRQAELIRKKLDDGLSLEAILSESAPPGFSEHHTGRAVDVTTTGIDGLEPEFETADAFRWLTHNASQHGFLLSFPHGNRYGYVYEPWHWCYQIRAT
jgi:zinc D-Ala-D-Ala carboxypeptidase